MCVYFLVEVSHYIDISSSCYMGAVGRCSIELGRGPKADR